MKIETEVREDHQAKLTVQIEVERLDEMKRRAASKIARKVKLPGFRPGKAPYAVIVRQVGEAAVLEEAIEMLVEEVYPQVIKESEISAYGPGQLDGVPSMDPLTLEFVVPLEAEVTLGDYRSIQKPYEPVEVTDEDVDAVVQDLRERQAIIEPVERAAEIGDQVAVLLSAKRLNVEEGEEDSLVRERSYPIVVRPADDPDDEEWPFSGFSQNLIGLSAGDEKTLEYTYPDDSPYETLRGATAEFKFTIENVKARTLPDVDDELAKSVGEFETLDALRENIRESLVAEREQAYNDEYDEEIMGQAVESTTYKYPPQMLQREVDNVIENLAHRLEHQNATIDLYLKSRGMEMEELRKEVEPVAETRLKRALFLVEFGKAENVQVKPEELEKEAVSTMNYLMQSLPEKDAKMLSNRDVQSNIVGNVLADLLSNRAMGRFRNLARGIEEEDTTEETGEAGSEDVELPEPEVPTAEIQTEAASDQEPAAEETESQAGTEEVKQEAE